MRRASTICTLKEPPWASGHEANPIKIHKSPYTAPEPGFDSWNMVREGRQSRWGVVAHCRESCDKLGYGRTEDLWSARGWGTVAERGRMNQGSWQICHILKELGEGFPGSVVGVDIQHMHLMSHCVLSYSNYSVQARHSVSMSFTIISDLNLCLNIFVLIHLSLHRTMLFFPKKYATNLDCPFSSELPSDGSGMETLHQDSDECYPNITFSIIWWNEPVIYTYWSVENSATYQFLSVSLKPILAHTSTM